MRKLLSFVLVLCMMITCVLSTNLATLFTSAANVDNASVGASTGPQSDIQGSAILHCFNWSYNNIKNNLQAIKDAGYTAVQTSPVQTPKDYNPSWRDQQGQWWKLYQPLNFAISNNTWLGTKNDLKSLCDAAEKMGIKVVVDVVANHLSGNGGGGYGSLDGAVDGSLKRWEYFHDYHDGANDSSRYAMTMGHIGMPDLNTANGDVQRIVKDFLIECINVGVDGFRFDAAKHIELPSDDGNRSEFWPTVINGSQAATSNKIYYYGEILNGCGTNINNYTKYMSITDNNSSDAILMAACNSNAQGLANSHFSKGAAADKNVLWVESHDTFMGGSGSAGMGNTSRVSDDKIIKAWAMVGSRAEASSLFFARSAHNMGDASTNTTWKSKPVAEVNKFKNYFDGQSEYLSSEGSIAYNERGTSGVVLVNASGTNCSVNVRANKMANGTYKDYVSGSTFTVSNGRITGNIGNTGVAVVYNQSNTPSDPTVPPTHEPTVKPTVAPTVKPTTPINKTMIGDVNADKKVSILDATCIQSHLSRMMVLDEQALVAADVNLNNKVAVKDATIIQLYLVGKPTEDSHCGEYSGNDPVVDDGKDYIYFKNTDNWSNVNFYYWSNANSSMVAWPGVAMESVGDGVYRIEAIANIDKVIFNNGSQQTPDLTFPGVNKIYDNGNWSDYSGGGNIVPTQPTEAQPNPANDKYIYYKNNENWNEVKAYYWSDSNDNMVGWPGVHMESIGNNVYRVEIPSDATKIIFNNNNLGRQTDDLRLEGMGKIYDNGWRDYTG